MVPADPEPVLTPNFIKEETFRPLLHMERASASRMVPQQRSLRTEGSAPVLLVETLGTTSSTGFWE